MTSGAGIVIPSSLDPAVEFTGSEFDAKVGRECRSDPVGDRERIKRNDSECKRSNFHGFAATIMTISKERGEPKAAETQVVHATKHLVRRRQMIPGHHYLAMERRGVQRSGAIECYLRFS